MMQLNVYRRGNDWYYSYSRFGFKATDGPFTTYVAALNAALELGKHVFPIIR